MILDYENLFSDAQALSGTANSTHVVDESAAINPGGGSKPARFVCRVTAKSGTTPTIRVQLVAASATNLTSNQVILYDSGVLSDPTIPLELSAILPNIVATKRQYYGVIYTLGGGTPTFTVTSGLVVDEASAYSS